MRPKLRGMLVLDEVLRPLPLDFVVACSSLASILGGFGQVDYCGANAFLDAVGHANGRKDGRFTTINWDTWQEVGMAVTTAVPPELKNGAMPR